MNVFPLSHHQRDKWCEYGWARGVDLFSCIINSRANEGKTNEAIHAPLQMDPLRLSRLPADTNPPQLSEKAFGKFAEEFWCDRPRSGYAT